MGRKRVAFFVVFPFLARRAAARKSTTTTTTQTIKHKQRNPKAFPGIQKPKRQRNLKHSKHDDKFRVHGKFMKTRTKHQHRVDTLKIRRFAELVDYPPRVTEPPRNAYGKGKRPKHKLLKELGA